MAKMDSAGLQLCVMTPTKTVVNTRVDFVLLRTVEGDMGVLRGHEACAVELDYGMLRANIDKQTAVLLVVMGGFASVKDNTVTVVSRMADAPDKIEQAMKEAEMERAENKLREQMSDLEMHRAEKALRRTLVHMDVSSYAVLKGVQEQRDEKEK